MTILLLLRIAQAAINMATDDETAVTDHMVLHVEVPITNQNAMGGIYYVNTHEVNLLRFRRLDPSVTALLS